MILWNPSKSLGLFLLGSMGLSFGFASRMSLVSLPDFFVRVDIFEIAMLGCLALFFLKPKAVASQLRDMQAALLFVMFMFAWLMLSVLFYGLNWFQVPFSVSSRAISQSVAIFSALLSGLVLYKVYCFDIDFFVKALLFGLAICLAGIAYQVYSEGFYQVVTFRLYGFSGEPKHLAMYLVPFIIALFLSKLYSISCRMLLLFLLLIMVVFTKSATGFLALLVSGCLAIICLRGGVVS